MTTTTPEQSGALPLAARSFAAVDPAHRSVEFEGGRVGLADGIPGWSAQGGPCVS